MLRELESKTPIFSWQTRLGRGVQRVGEQLHARLAGTGVRCELLEVFEVELLGLLGLCKLLGVLSCLSWRRRKCLNKLNQRGSELFERSAVPQNKLFKENVFLKASLNNLFWGTAHLVGWAQVVPAVGEGPRLQRRRGLCRQLCHRGIRAGECARGGVGRDLGLHPISSHRHTASRDHALPGGARTDSAAGFRIEPRWRSD